MICEFKMQLALNSCTPSAPPVMWALKHLCYVHVIESVSFVNINVSKSQYYVSQMSVTD